MVVLLLRGDGGQSAARFLAAGGRPTRFGGAFEECRSRHASPRLIMVLFLAITALGSSRNYGLRYLLPLAPLAIVWVSGLAEVPDAMDRCDRHSRPGVCGRVDPSIRAELFQLPGRRAWRRTILADSNLDWGQGLKELARLQREHPEYTDLTLYYFGDTDPRHYGVQGLCHVINADRVHSGLAIPVHGSDIVRRRFGLASVGPLGARRPLHAARQPFTRAVHRGHDDRDLPLASRSICR